MWYGYTFSINPFSQDDSFSPKTDKPVNNGRPIIVLIPSLRTIHSHGNKYDDCYFCTGPAVLIPSLRTIHSHSGPLKALLQAAFRGMKNERANFHNLSQKKN